MDNHDNDRIHEQSSEKHIYTKNRKNISYLAVGLIGALIGGFIMAAIAPYYIYGKLLPYPESGKDVPLNQSLAQPIVLNPSDNISIASAVAKKAMPSVVGISTISVQRDDLGFGRAVEGVGSGVIVHPNGYILTNSHVVGENAKRITVYMINGDELRGEVLWQDNSLDLAVVKVEATDLPAAELGDSDIVLVGETAIAIGNPLGLRYERTVTQGIISGLNRSIWVSNTELMEDLIQTDAAINPGNSGGPLINSLGEVIGINTVKAATAEGLGFALPINVTKPIVKKFIEKGRFIPIYMGIKLLDNEFASIYYPGIDLQKGILITEVMADTPAAKAGLQSQDIITHIDNKEVNTMIKFKALLFEHNPGEKALVRYVRDKKVYEAEVTLMAKPEE